MENPDEKKPNGQDTATPPLEPPAAGEQYIAVPLTVFQVVFKTISGLPYEQVEHLVPVLRSCQPVQVIEPADE